MTNRKTGDPRRRKPALDETGVLIEFHRLGNVVKVTAVDPESLLEASIVGDPAMSEASLAHAAIRKLRYVLERRRARDKAADGGDRAGEGGPATTRRRGTLV